VAVSSAGIYANDGQTAEPDAILAAQESGADIGAHRATSLGPNGLNGSDWIVVMEKRHAHFIKKMMPAVDHQICLLGQYHPSGNVIEIPDPYGGSLSHYRQSLNLIKECMVKVVALLGERVTIM
jgi:protein-tyrosine phosphatase